LSESTIHWLEFYGKSYHEFFEAAWFLSEIYIWKAISVQTSSKGV